MIAQRGPAPTSDEVLDLCEKIQALSDKDQAWKTYACADANLMQAHTALERYAQEQLLVEAVKRREARER
jgi:hypothetical protein